MERLIAKYQIELIGQILAQRLDTDRLKYELVVDDADVEVQLISYKNPKGRAKNKRLWTFALDYVEISVSLSEQEVPPPADVKPKDGHGSYYEIEQYFEKRIRKYTEIAKKVYYRLVKFFKYKYGSPFLIEENELSNFPLPTWSDEKGTEIWKTRSRAVYVSYIPGAFKSEFGIKKFRKKDDKKLIAAIRNEIDVTLYQEIMSDAQTAILQNNYRRGILEMAIACEIAVKQLFFAESAVSGATYEYLEDQGRIHVRTIDFISNVAEYIVK